MLVLLRLDETLDLLLGRVLVLTRRFGLRLWAYSLWGLSQATGAQAAQTPLIINDPQWPPYYFAGQADSPPGLMKEILTQCFAGLKIPIEFRNQPIERMQVGIEMGDVDLTLFSRKPEREPFVQFGQEVLFTTSYRPIVRADSSIQVKTLADFDKYRMGHTLGLRYSKEFYNYIQKRKENGTLDESSKEEFNIRKLEANRIDVFVSTDSTIMYVAKKIGLDSKIKFLDFEIQKADYFLAVSKKSPRIPDRSALINQLEDCIRKGRKTRETCAIYQKYNIPCPRK